MKQSRFIYTGRNFFARPRARESSNADSLAQNLFDLINQYSVTMGDRAAGMTQEAISNFLHTYADKTSLTWGQSLEVMKQFVDARSNDLTMLSLETNNCLELASEFTATGVDNAQGFMLGLYRMCLRLSGSLPTGEVAPIDMSDVPIPANFDFQLALGPRGETIRMHTEFQTPTSVMSYLYPEGQNFLLNGMQWLFIADAKVVRLAMDAMYYDSPVQNWISAPLASHTSYAELSDVITTFTSSQGSVDSSMLLARSANYLSPEIRSFVLKMTQKMHSISKVGFVSCLGSYLSSLSFDVDDSGKVLGASRSTVVSSIANVAGFVVSLVVTATSVILSYFFKGVGLVVSAALAAISSLISWKNEATSIQAPNIDVVPQHLLSGAILMDAIKLPHTLEDLDVRVRSKLIEFGCVEVAFNGGVLVLYLDDSNVHGQFMLELTPPANLEGTYIIADGTKGWDKKGNSLAWKVKVPMATDAQTANAPEVQGFMPRYSEKSQLVGVDFSLVHIFAMLKFAYCLLCAKWNWDLEFATIAAYPSESAVPASDYSPIGYTTLRAGTNDPYADGSYPIGLPGSYNPATYFAIGKNALRLTNESALMVNYIGNSVFEDVYGRTYTPTPDDIRLALASHALNCFSSFCEIRPFNSEYTVPTTEVQECFQGLQTMCDNNGSALVRLIDSLVLPQSPSRNGLDDRVRCPGSPEFAKEDFDNLPNIPMLSTKSVNKVLTAIAVTAGVAAAASIALKIGSTKIQRSWNNRISTAEEVAKANLGKGSITAEEYSKSLAATSKQRKRMSTFFKANDAGFAAQEGAGVVETMLNNVTSVTETAISNSDQLLDTAADLGIAPLSSPSRDLALDVDVGDVYSLIAPIPQAYENVPSEEEPAILTQPTAEAFLP